MLVGHVRFTAAILLSSINSGLVVADSATFDYASVSNYFGSDNESMTWVAPRPLKFQQWYPNLEVVCQYASAITCNATLQAYLGSEEERRQLGPVESYCNTHINCMLSNMPEKVKSNMAASAVVLGLIPSILASLGPSVAEISLLSLQRPLLAFLLSLGSPVIYSSRYGTYDNPFDTLEVITGALVVPRIEKYAGVISAVQYIFAFGAVANTLLVSYQIGARGILSWACSVSYLPLYWSFTTVIIHNGGRLKPDESQASDLD
ncbi:hypothetical protein G7054_g944 [Neopestalotiopsis clavispora]|nr:hypothetical protein G7054_g944 [Neopestalotiopsis clavispora]